MTDDEIRAQYDAEKRRAGRALAETDRASFHRITGEVTELYRAQPKGFRRCMDEVERRMGALSGFPPFLEWSAGPIEGNGCLIPRSSMEDLS